MFNVHIQVVVFSLFNKTQMSSQNLYCSTVSFMSDAFSRYVALLSAMICDGDAENIQKQSAIISPAQAQPQALSDDYLVK